MDIKRPACDDVSPVLPGTRPGDTENREVPGWAELHGVAFKRSCNLHDEHASALANFQPAAF